MDTWTVGKLDSYQTYLQFIATGIFVLLCLILVLGAFIGGSEIASGDNNQLYNTTTTSQTTMSTGKTNSTYLELNLLQKYLVLVLLFQIPLLLLRLNIQLWHMNVNVGVKYIL